MKKRHAFSNGGELRNILLWFYGSFTIKQHAHLGNNGLLPLAAEPATRLRLVRHDGLDGGPEEVFPVLGARQRVAHPVAEAVVVCGQCSA